ncbi:MAG: 1,4-beta-xylanase [Lachnospiraceae bacterium]|nr:1,4-beta-xylanase [Lachnospiraceae bacterium]
MRVKKNGILLRIFCMVMVIATMLANVSVDAFAAENNLLNTYGSYFGRVGTCINLNQLQNGTTLQHVKSQYNSITLENEMKPDHMLGGSATLITVSQAKSLGYYIPNNYKEAYVPKINFDTVDKTLKICYENGIGVRAHTLVWHSQTPSWFFRNNYSGNGGYVSPSTMDARMEFYIKTVMNHVYTGKYGSCVYAWDVVNEYLHATNSGWEAVYGKGGTSPEFVKKAFQFAYDTISYFKLTDKVSLFYNDFNTYIDKDKVIKLINFINSDKKICNGVGMQSHVGVTYPSVDYYTQALQAFVNAGFEVQITELDCGNKSESQQANYLYQLMSNVIKIKKAGGKITGVTFWGISDDVSWVKENNPLLFSRFNTPKSSYYKVLQAYTDAGLQQGSTGSNNSFSNTGTTATLKDGWYYIKNVNAQKYLQVAGNNGSAGANVELGTGNGAAGQKWYLTNKGNGAITLKNALGYMLDVTGGKNEEAVNIEIWNENGKDPQTFMLKSAGNNQYGIVTKSSNYTKGLDAANKGTTDGTNVIQYSYYGGVNQVWVFEATNYTQGGSTGTNANVVVADGWYYIKNINAQKYLQVAGNTGANGQNVEISKGTGVSGQKWYVTNTGDGYVTLKNGTGYMLDIAYGEDVDGANVQIYTEHNQDPQKFKIVKEANGNYGILTKASADKKSLDVYEFGTADGSNVCQWTYYKNSCQLWKFEACN